MRLILLCFMVLVAGLGFAQADSLLSQVLWEETTAGERKGYILRLNQYGSFEEDAGENYRRKSRYLMGRWETDSLQTKLTLAVDYFMGQNLVHRHYRDGQDFYLHYRIVERTEETLALEDELTGERRTFVARPIADALDAAERRAEKIKFGKQKKGGLKLPKGW